MFQFLHIDSYSLSTPKKGKQGGHCVASIVGEALRNPRNCPHIAFPKQPIKVYGKNLEDLESACVNWSESLAEVTGRKTRKDALCLVAGVVSAPHTIDTEAWQKFRGETVEWLKRKYGDQLHTVLEHTDEDNPHIHFYVVPRTGQRFDSIHDGKRAASENTGILKRAQNEAYKAAMRALLDNFNASVGLPNGMLRYGPRRRRLTRRAWKEEQAQASGLMIQLESIASRKESFEKASKEMKSSLKAAHHNARLAGYNHGIENFEKHSFLKKLIVSSRKAQADILRLKERVAVTTKELEAWKSKARKINVRSKEFFTKWQDMILKYSEIRNKLAYMVSISPRAEELHEELESVRAQLKEETRRRSAAEDSLEASQAAEERNGFPKSARVWLEKSQLRDGPAP